MQEIRIHCRGGQGGLTAARIIVDAALKDGKRGQAFPEFGPERQGAPVKSFARIDDDFVRVKATIESPDIVMVFDRSLLENENAAVGLKSDGVLILNCDEIPEKIPCDQEEIDAYKVDATGLAKEHLGREIPNTAMLGAFSKATGLIKIEAMKQAIEDWFGEKIGPMNAEVAEHAYDQTDSVHLVDECVPPSIESGEYNDIDDYPEMVISRPKVGASGETGNWRTEKPIIDYSTCVNCLQCYVSCPEGVIERNREEDRVEVDFDYCKSCGICVDICPVDAITMEQR